MKKVTCVFKAQYMPCLLTSTQQLRDPDFMAVCIFTGKEWPCVNHRSHTLDLELCLSFLALMIKCPVKRHPREERVYLTHCSRSQSITGEFRVAGTGHIISQSKERGMKTCPLAGAQCPLHTYTSRDPCLGKWSSHIN